MVVFKRIDAESALTHLNKGDILILDINMPKVDGIAVLQSFVKSGFQQKVIVLSSYDDAKLIKDSIKERDELKTQLNQLDEVEKNSVGMNDKMEVHNKRRNFQKQLYHFLI